MANPLDDDMIALLGIMSRQQWNVYWCTTCAEALEMLDNSIVPVMVCESTLPDGAWHGLLEQVNRRAEPPRFIVASRLADENLWSEALNLCAYDVLAKPFDRTEVVRVISTAISSWLCEREERKHYAAFGEVDS